MVVELSVVGYQAGNLLAGLCEVGGDRLVCLAVPYLCHFGQLSDVIVELFRLFEKCSIGENESQ